MNFFQGEADRQEYPKLFDQLLAEEFFCIKGCMDAGPLADSGSEQTMKRNRNKATERIRAGVRAQSARWSVARGGMGAMPTVSQENQPVQLTLVLIKPDALKLSLTGYILSQLSEFHTGLRFAGAKIVHVSRRLAEEHYAEHRGKPFYPALIHYIMGKSHYPDLPHRRRVIALVYSGVNAVQTVRRIAGPTNPHEARETAPGTIRALGTVVPVTDAEGRIISERLDNLIHASATPQEAEREIKLWFTPTDIMPFMRIYPTDYTQEHYYLSDGGLSTSWSPGSRCVIPAGALVWKSDLETLHLWQQGKPTPISLDAVIAKYLINTEQSPAE